MTIHPQLLKSSKSNIFTCVLFTCSRQPNAASDYMKFQKATLLTRVHLSGDYFLLRINQVHTKVFKVQEQKNVFTENKRCVQRERHVSDTDCFVTGQQSVL